MRALYRNRIEYGCIGVIKFTDKNRWRQGKIAAGFPEFLIFYRSRTFNVSPPSICYVMRTPIKGCRLFLNKRRYLTFFFSLSFSSSISLKQVKMENSRHARLTLKIGRSVDTTCVSEFNPAIDSNVEFLPVSGTEMPSTLALFGPWLDSLKVSFFFF